MTREILSNDGVPRTTGGLSGSRVGSAVESPADSIDLSSLARTLWRGKWLIAACTVLMIAIGGWYAFIGATPTFSSTAVVMLDTQQDQVTGLESVVTGLSGESTEVNSELEVLRSRRLAGSVVEQLNLTEDPEFNLELRELNGFAAFEEAAKNWVKGLLGMPVNQPPADPETQARRTRDAVITTFLNNLTVQNVPQTYVFRITMESVQGRKAALIVDTLAQSYIDNQLNAKFEAMEQASAWLTNRVADLQVQLEQAEAERADFSKSIDLVSAEALAAQERQLKDLRDRVAGATAAAATAAATAEALRGAETRAERAALAGDTQLDRFLVRAETDPAIAEAFDTRFDQLVQRADLEVVRAEQQRDALSDSAESLGAEIARQTADLIRLQQLNREAEALRLLYEQFLTRLNETVAQQGIQQADSRILSEAVVPLSPASPNRALVLILSAFAGIVLGAAVVMFRESRLKGFFTSEDLELATGYVVVGETPLIPARQRRRVLEYLDSKPASAQAEAFRSLRTSVAMLDPNNPPRVIAITSSVPAEGKTTNSLSLAKNFGQLGHSVVIVEADIRRRVFNRYFETLPEKGLANYLSEDIALEEVISRPPNYEADVIQGGTSRTNPADLLTTKKFETLVATLADRYDMVIIDTPPILAVPDFRIIAPHCDTLLINVKWNSTSRAQLSETMRQIRGFNRQHVGLILSRVSPRGMRRYGYAERYGAYSAYGSKYYAK